MPISPRSASAVRELPSTVASLLIFLTGAAVVAFYIPQLPHSGLVGLVLLALMAAASEKFSILVYGDAKVSISFICLFAIAVLYGPPGIVVATPLAIVAMHFPKNIRSTSFLFNIGNSTLADAASAIILLSMVGHQSDLLLSANVVVAALLATTANYGVRAILISGSRRPQNGTKRHWRCGERSSNGYFHITCCSVFSGWHLLSPTSRSASPACSLSPPAPIMMRLAMKQYVDKTTRNVAMLKRKNEQLQKANREILAMSERLKDTYEATLEALAAALDARDSETGGHSSRVTVYTMDMARELGVLEEGDDWLDIERAALLHDVGKIGVSDAILNKPGPLTSEEWQQMRKHPAIGYEMLKDVKFLSRAAEIVYAHHERYDGRGYPTGLKGGGRASWARDIRGGRCVRRHDLEPAISSGALSGQGTRRDSNQLGNPI